MNIRSLGSIAMSPKSYVIHVEPVVVNISPLGFHRYATEFLTAARSIPPLTSFSPVPYNLYCRSVELAFKAFLLARGINKRDLMKRDVFRHDLIKGLALAEKHDFGNFVTVTSAHKVELEKANKFYDAKVFEYFDVTKALTGYSGLPDLSILDDLAASTIANIESLCKSA